MSEQLNRPRIRGPPPCRPRESHSKSCMLKVRPPCWPRPQYVTSLSLSRKQARLAQAIPIGNSNSTGSNWWS